MNLGLCGNQLPWVNAGKHLVNLWLCGNQLPWVNAGKHLVNLWLCGNQLPWVDAGKHLVNLWLCGNQLPWVDEGKHLVNLWLCGNQLPWVNAGKHLGMKLENKPGTTVKQDMKEKRAQYIQRNNELMQEFSYANSTTKTKINSIYNSHFTGSCGTYSDMKRR